MKFGIPAIDDSNATHIVSSDETGYGAVAGPLCIGVVCVPRDWKPPPGLTDSKKLSWANLVRLAEGFQKEPTLGALWEVFTYDREQIDQIGVGRCLRQAHEFALDRMARYCREVLGGIPAVIVDGNMTIPGAVSLPKADKLLPACSMAACIAKVHHDRLMHDLDKQYPGYDFANSVGYISPAHIAGLKKLGPCDLHRRSYNTYAKYSKPETTDDWLFEFDV